MPTGHVEVARLLASELVTNAVQHGLGEVVLVVARRGDGLRVEVHDGSPVLPALTEHSSLMERGWGLRLVAALASTWGAGPRDDGQSGKLVWFTLA
jgi:anti-sigma regulatory factor (Ser/Thr protein kinase)